MAERPEPDATLADTSPTQARPAVRVQGVTRTYSQGGHSVHALAGVDLCIAAGEFVSLSGPSGSGKSTLLNVIGGLDRPTAGEVWIGGVPLSTLDAAALAALRLHRIGFVFQAYNLIPVLSARENVEFVLQLQGVAPATRRARACGPRRSEHCGACRTATRRHVGRPTAARGRCASAGGASIAAACRRAECKSRLRCHTYAARIAAHTERARRRDHRDRDP